MLKSALTPQLKASQDGPVPTPALDEQQQTLTQEPSSGEGTSHDDDADVPQVLPQFSWQNYKPLAENGDVEIEVEPPTPVTPWKRLRLRRVPHSMRVANEFRPLLPMPPTPEKKTRRCLCNKIHNKAVIKAIEWAAVSRARNSQVAIRDANIRAINVALALEAHEEQHHVCARAGADPAGVPSSRSGRLDDDAESF